ncbi:MAG: hypothetical protein MUF44_16695 [Hydrogenophaga sp.]|jgi:hypothetical protein|nr:hypothetical protein [Hydrogenophaga sp.]
MKRALSRGLRLAGACLVALAASGCQGLMPTPETPYQLAAPGDAVPTGATWTWLDARPEVVLDNASTNDGMRFGDAVMNPRPFVQLQAEFARAVTRHEAAAELRDKLNGKTIRVRALTLEVGLWVRLSQRQDGRWEFVRTRIELDVDGSRYEALDVHKFDNGERPSPLSTPLRNAAENLVQQIHLF